MRILYFSRAYTTHDWRFLHKLAESPHETWFLQLEDDGLVYEQRTLPAKIRTVDWQGGKGLVRSATELMRLKPHFEAVLARIRPDLIHAGPIPSCGFLAACTGFRPLLVMSWGADLLVDADRNVTSRRVAEYTLQNADMLLCDCDAARRKAQQLAGDVFVRVVQFPWGIDLQKFGPGPDSLRLRDSRGWENAFVILSTRTWVPGYGLEVLLEAFRLAHRQNSRLRLVLLGDGPLGNQVECFLSAHGLQEAVFRPGRVPQEKLPDYLRAADVYASCVPMDGTSVSLLEALATGLPVVVSDVEGNREWVRQDENGWLASPGNSKAFAQLFLRAAELDQTRRADIAHRNRCVAEERANWDVNSTRLLEAYDKLAGFRVCRQDSL